MRKLFVLVVILIAGLLGYRFLSERVPIDTKADPATKRVEEYFVEHMHVSPDEAKEMATDGVDLRVSDNATLVGIVGNLYYYGFIDNEDAFVDLLAATTDSTPGRADAIRVGTKTIDIDAHYYLTYQMSEEEIADTLLNRGRHDENFSRYNYLFMPSSPSISSSDTPAETTLEGKYSCLPSAKTSGPVTLECALGIEANDGFYYALDTSSLPSETMYAIATGTRIAVFGTVVPIVMISTNQWQKYAIAGIMKVETLRKL